MFTIHGSVSQITDSYVMNACKKRKVHVSNIVNINSNAEQERKREGGGAKSDPGENFGKVYLFLKLLYKTMYIYNIL